MENKRIVHRMTLFLLFTVIVFFTVTIFTSDKTEPFYKLNSETLDTGFNNGWYVNHGAEVGSHGKINLPHTVRLKENETLIMKKKMPAVINEDMIFMLLGFFEDYRVLVDDKTVKSYTSIEKGFFNRDAGISFIKVKLDGNMSGKEITVELPRTNTVTRKAAVYSTFLGEDGKVYLNFLYNNLFIVFLLCLIAMTWAVSFVFYFILRKTLNNRRLLYFGAFVLCITISTSLKSNLTYYYFSNKILMNMFKYSAYLLSVTYFIEFIKTYEKFEKNITLDYFRFTSIGIFVVAFSLNVFGILEIQPFILFAFILSCTVSIYVSAVILLDFLSERNKTDFGLLLSMIILLASDGVEFIYYIENDAFCAIYKIIAVLLIAIVVIYGAVKEAIIHIKYVQKKSVYETLALKDTLTGLNNQNAFVIDTESMRGKGKMYAVIIFDINDLKQINDTHGHSEGNKVVKKTAEILRFVFKEPYKIYRSGGDEFTVIVEAPAEKEIISLISDFDEMVMKESEKLEYNYCVASGYAYTTKKRDNLMDVLKRADKAMYRKKERVKNYISAGD